METHAAALVALGVKNVEAVRCAEAVEGRTVGDHLAEQEPVVALLIATTGNLLFFLGQMVSRAI